MVSSRTLSSLLFAATAAFLISAFLLTGKPRLICFSAFFLLLGISIGFLVRQKMIHQLADAGKHGFGDELLNSTINEMHEALVVSESFEGKGLVERHQAVYGPLGDAMKARIHALTLKGMTPNQYQSRR